MGDGKKTFAVVNVIKTLLHFKKRHMIYKINIDKKFEEI